MIFESTGTHRIEAHTELSNLAEQCSLEAVGFSREGVIRAGLWRDGEYRDGPLYSLLRSDWHSEGGSYGR